LTEHLSLRLDSEFCQKSFLGNLDRIRAWPAGWIKLGDEISEISGGATPLGADYPDDGVKFLRVQNIMPNYIESADLTFISHEDDKTLARSRLKLNDVLLTITGVSYGKSSVVTSEYVGSNINQHSVRMALRPGRIRPYFLAAFLNAGPGKAQSDQNVTGGTRPALDYTTIRHFSVPLMSNGFQATIEETIKTGHQGFLRAIDELAAAEQTLLHALGLDAWQPPEPLTYVRRASEVAQAARFDSEFFAPRTLQLLAKLGAGGRTIRDVAPPRHEEFRPAGGPGEFDYIEIGSLRGDGTVGSERLACADAPSRATWHVRGGDVVTSTVRPNRRLSALITPEQTGYVASSGFVVLQPQAVSAEVLLTYLRLPPVCEVMDLHTSASLYPTISETDLLKLPFPKLDQKTCDEITAAVRAAHAARREAQALLARAQRAVEIAIEQGEFAALTVLATPSS
jgi:type I restriction enzyme S subunit